MKDLKFGWHMPSFPVDGSDGAAFVEQIDQTLERVHPHFDSVWVDDHMMPWAQWQSNDTPYLECMTTITHFAARYPSLDFGASVLCQAYRNPALLAKMAANLQLLTGGRFIFGIGAGWMEEEFSAYNFDYPKASVRIAQLEEAVQIVKMLGTESPANFRGRALSHRQCLLRAAARSDSAHSDRRRRRTTDVACRGPACGLVEHPRRHAGELCAQARRAARPLPCGGAGLR